MNGSDYSFHCKIEYSNAAAMEFKIKTSAYVENHIKSKQFIENEMHRPNHAIKSKLCKDAHNIVKTTYFIYFYFFLSENCL